MPITKEEYEQSVKDVARAILTKLDSQEWLKNAKDGECPCEFSDWLDDMEYSGQVSEEMDSLSIVGGDWKTAIEVLQVTSFNPDYVDSGLYEGCNWKQMLTRIAYECFRNDVQDQMQELFDAQKEGRGINEEVLLAYPTNDLQIGYFPKTQKFRIPTRGMKLSVNCGVGRWSVGAGECQIIEMGSDSGIKVYIPGKSALTQPEFSVVFAGKTTRGRGDSYIVDAVRVYTQTDLKIEEALKRCLEEYGIEKVESQRSRRSRRCARGACSE